MFNFDLTEYQKTFTEQTEKVRALTEKAFKLNSEFVEAAVARQTQAVTEIAKTNTEYVKDLFDIEKLKTAGTPSTESAEKLMKDGENYLVDVKESLTAVYDENTTSLKKYQTSMEKIVSELGSITEAKKAPAKKTAKAA